MAEEANEGGHDVRGDRESRVFAAMFAIGLGLCWASQEMVVLCVSRSLGTPDIPTSTYLTLRPLVVAVGLLFAMIGPRGNMFLRRGALYAVASVGLIGVFVFALFIQVPFLMLAGFSLFVVAAAIVMICWLKVLSGSSENAGRRAIVVTAAISTAGTLLWALDGTVLVLLAAIMFSASASILIAASAQPPAADSSDAADAKPLELVPWRWAAVVGAGVLMTSFGFLQFTVYHYSHIDNTPHEFFAHALALLMLLLVLYAARDREPAIGSKLAVTAMLFAFVFMSVYRDFAWFPTVLVEAAEGMFELVICYALMDFVRRNGLSAWRVFGWNTVFTGAAQALGSGLSVVEHLFFSSDAYSVLGLLLVSLLIVTAIWLLNDKTIAGFLWGDAPVSGKNAAAGERSFDEKAAAVSEAYRLTARECEVMLLFAKGRSSSFIAESFCVSTNTVRSHIVHLYAKCDVHSRQELISLIDNWQPES
ncbi:LuxR C-terminal-related transcriptional regulator [Adlercreutzia sp. R21]|uniref:helix-turn-helix transcriptional regulator n=1 Tax=Adlercreutzia wanghongyangiae TaxID=3111451 RepID=UPI002DB9C49E|nr:LuxR C-terminal-related transcriptional regulator [Adlercreutzia sp. R21]MEC4183985.1 LuxR C-terminal-related transcriptional regulator [Adlercreutzia sp. R21]